jgi:hypothetical protein
MKPGCFWSPWSIGIPLGSIPVSGADAAADERSGRWHARLPRWLEVNLRGLNGNNGVLPLRSIRQLGLLNSQ